MNEGSVNMSCASNTIEGTEQIPGPRLLVDVER
jgi:hypothetical protein